MEYSRYWYFKIYIVDSSTTTQKLLTVLKSEAFNNHKITKTFHGIKRVENYTSIKGILVTSYYKCFKHIKEYLHKIDVTGLRLEQAHCYCNLINEAYLFTKWE